MAIAPPRAIYEASEISPLMPNHFFSNKLVAHSSVSLFYTEGAAVFRVFEGVTIFCLCAGFFFLAELFWGRTGSSFSILMVLARPKPLWYCDDSLRLTVKPEAVMPLLADLFRKDSAGRGSRTLATGVSASETESGSEPVSSRLCLRASDLSRSVLVVSLALNG